jgi:hypothetical protein
MSIAYIIKLCYTTYIAVNISVTTAKMLPVAMMTAFDEFGHFRLSVPYILLLKAVSVSEMTNCKDMRLHTTVSTTLFTFKGFQESKREGLQKIIISLKEI